MFEQESILKNTAAQQVWHGNLQAQTTAKDVNGWYEPSLREQSELMVGHHRQEADKHDRAVAFFRENPAFDEFVRLIREGVVRI